MILHIILILFVSVKYVPNNILQIKGNNLYTLQLKIFILVTMTTASMLRKT
jgi:hypothetical protein